MGTPETAMAGRALESKAPTYDVDEPNKSSEVEAAIIPAKTPTYSNFKICACCFELLPL